MTPEPASQEAVAGATLRVALRKGCHKGKTGRTFKFEMIRRATGAGQPASPDRR